MPQKKSELYYEAHITIDPVTEHEDREIVRAIGLLNGFRLANLVMLKGGEHDKDSFMTARSDDFSDISKATKDMVSDLNRMGFKVRRYKIEDTLVDSNIKDEMGLL